MSCSLLERCLMLAMTGIELADGVDKLGQCTSMLSPRIGFDAADNIHSPGAEQVNGTLHIFRCEPARDDDRGTQPADERPSAGPIKSLAGSAALCASRTVDQPGVRLEVGHSVQGRGG